MTKKEGQVTLFIIVALVLISSIGIYFLISKPEVLETSAEKPDSPVYSYLESCLRNAVFEAVDDFGIHQGYYEVPDLALNTALYRVAYYYFQGTIIIPGNDFFEKEFSKIINDKILEQCSDFSFFEEEDYNIDADAEKINTETRISENDLKIDVTYPISIRTNESSTRFSDFSYDLPLRIGHVIDMSRILADKIKEEPSSVDLTFLLNQDADISIVDYDECNKIYIIVDNESGINDEPYAFSFAVGLEEQYCAGENL